MQPPKILLALSQKSDFLQTIKQSKGLKNAFPLICEELTMDIISNPLPL